MIFAWFRLTHLGNKGKTHVIAFFKIGTPVALCKRKLVGSFERDDASKNRCEKCTNAVEELEEAFREKIPE